VFVFVIVNLKAMHMHIPFCDLCVCVSVDGSRDLSCLVITRSTVRIDQIVMILEAVVPVPVQCTGAGGGQQLNKGCSRFICQALAATGMCLRLSVVRLRPARGRDETWCPGPAMSAPAVRSSEQGMQWSSSYSFHRAVAMAHHGVALHDKQGVISSLGVGEGAAFSASSM
jgi:hypothetical protein